MKKKDIIKLIQNKEALAYLDLQQCIGYFGSDHKYTYQSRTKWGYLNVMMKEIGIKPNLELEATKQGEKMVLDIYKNEFT